MAEPLRQTHVRQLSWPRNRAVLYSGINSELCNLLHPILKVEGIDSFAVESADDIVTKDITAAASELRGKKYDHLALFGYGVNGFTALETSFTASTFFGVVIIDPQYSPDSQLIQTFERKDPKFTLNAPVLIIHTNTDQLEYSNQIASLIPRGSVIESEAILPHVTNFLIPLAHKPVYYPLQDKSGPYQQRLF